MCPPDPAALGSFASSRNAAAPRSPPMTFASVLTLPNPRNASMPYASCTCAPKSRLPLSASSNSTSVGHLSQRRRQSRRHPRTMSQITCSWSGRRRPKIREHRWRNRARKEGVSRMLERNLITILFIGFTFFKKFIVIFKSTLQCFPQLEIIIYILTRIITDCTINFKNTATQRE